MNTFVLVLALLPQTHAPYPKPEPDKLVGKWQLTYNNVPGYLLFKQNGVYVQALEVSEAYRKTYGKYRYFMGKWYYNKRTHRLKLYNERSVESANTIVYWGNDESIADFNINLKWNGYKYTGKYFNNAYDLDFQLYYQRKK
jgi:hypothetical protein